VGGLLIIIILFGAVWLLLLMPARRRRAQHEAMQSSVDVGDEIITAGGLHGTVKEIDEETARVEIAPTVVVTLDRRAIAAVATEIAAVATEIEVEPEPESEPERPPEPS
jgi:preprotein translocase subunit YajC